jgi:hypothetical protein
MTLPVATSTRPSIIVLIHLGPSKPRWLRPSLKAQAKVHGVENVVLVAESSALLRMAERVGVHAFEYTGDADRDSVLARAQSRAPTFRDGFWSHSLRRVFALESIASAASGPLIHVESDVVALKDLRSVVPGVHKSVAYPLLAPGLGSGSIIAVRSHEAARWLADQTLLAVTQRGSANDMQALWEVWKAHPNEVQILPSLPHDAIETAPESDGSVPLFGDIIAPWQVYDAAAIGQFLLGADPRNSRWGLRRIGGTYQQGSRPPLRWDQLSLDMDGGLFLEDRDAVHEVVTLHNHSKDLRAFDRDSLIPLLQRRISHSRAFTGCDPWALSVNLRAAARRRLGDARRSLTRKVSRS